MMMKDICFDCPSQAFSSFEIWYETRYGHLQGHTRMMSGQMPCVQQAIDAYTVREKSPAQIDLETNKIERESKQTLTGSDIRFSIHWRT
jgi:hypothetical protein